jgi:hypothetical protein
VARDVLAEVHTGRCGLLDDTDRGRHGAIRRPVLPLRLTKSGRETLLRWSAYTPLGSHERR